MNIIDRYADWLISDRGDSIWSFAIRIWSLLFIVGVVVVPIIMFASAIIVGLLRGIFS